METQKHINCSWNFIVLQEKALEDIQSITIATRTSSYHKKVQYKSESISIADRSPLHHTKSDGYPKSISIAAGIPSPLKKREEQ
jgi:hypothetical protein